MMESSSEPRAIYRRPTDRRHNLRNGLRFQDILVLSLPTLAVLGGLFPVIGPFFAFRVAVPLLLIAVLFTGQGHYPRSGLRPLALVLCWVWAVASTGLALFAPRTPGTWTEAHSVVTGLALLMAVALTPPTRRSVMQWLRGWLLAYAICAAVATWEITTGSHLGNYFVYNLHVPEWTSTRTVAGTLGNPNNYAFFLVVSIALMAAGAAGALYRLERALFLLAAFSAPVFLVATESRLVMAVSCLMLLIYALYYRRGWLLLASPLLLAAVLVMLSNPAAVISMIDSTADSWESVLSRDASTRVRVHLMFNGAIFAAQTGLIGLGPGNFESRMASGGPFPTEGILSPHSALVEVLSQYGAVVFILLITVGVVVLLIAIRAAADPAMTPFDRALGLNLAILLACSPILTAASSSTLDVSFPWVAGALIFQAALFLNARLGDRVKDSMSRSRGGGLKRSRTRPA